MAFIYFSLFRVDSHAHSYETVDLIVLSESALGRFVQLRNGDDFPWLWLIWSEKDSRCGQTKIMKSLNLLRQK